MQKSNHKTNTFRIEFQSINEIHIKNFDKKKFSRNLQHKIHINNFNKKNSSNNFQSNQ